MADFLNTVASMRNGRVIADCSLKLSKVIEGVKATGKKGKLILEIGIEPSRVSMDGVTEMELRHTAKAVVPEADQGKTIFFISGNDELTRDDPAQMQFEMEAIDGREDNLDHSRSIEGAD